MSILSICLPTYFALLKRVSKNGRPSLFSRYGASSRLRLLRTYKKQTSSTGITNEALPIQRAHDVELGKWSSESTSQNMYGDASASCLASAKTASGDGSDLDRIQVPESAIRVRSEITVHAGA